MSIDNSETPFIESIETPQHQLKLVILGESAVGKTSFLHQFVNNNFVDKREPTVGAGFLTKTWRVDDRLVKINAWDTAGQERFHSLAPMYYRGAQAAIVMYDVTKEATFERAKSWVQELQRLAPAHIVITLVGNKIDLCGEDDDNNNDQVVMERQGREVSIEEATNYAAENALLFFESSARLNKNIDAVFTKIGGGNRGFSNNNSNNSNGRIDLDQEMNNAKKSSAGCAC
ncbi:RAB5B, member ras oncogene family-like protein [Cunninghamella echinulata]|nr:RAB5B, member ras oncogene family-like protein [Cunninghamella echinulata]